MDYVFERDIQVGAEYYCFESQESAENVDYIKRPFTQLELNHKNSLSENILFFVIRRIATIRIATALSVREFCYCRRTSFVFQVKLKI